MIAAIDDWDAAYFNGATVDDPVAIADGWARDAAAFRNVANVTADIAYGDSPRARLDLFRTDGEPKGLLVFIHGGYWMKYDKSWFSHFAAGPLARGWAVAVPSYTLCPDASITEIGAMAGQAIDCAAEQIGGPIVVTGHSAGGHLAARTAAIPGLSQSLDRVRKVVPISGVHDLRPLLRTAMNDTLKLSAEEAVRESPALLTPVESARVTCWVGAAELPEFLRQNALLANVWRGLGAATDSFEDPGANHFSVVDKLADPDSGLTNAVTTLD